MKTYNNFELSEALHSYLVARKGGIFMRAYYKEHGEYPTNEDVEKVAEIIRLRYDTGCKCTDR